MKKVKFACPKCLELVDELIEVVQAVKTYRVKITDNEPEWLEKDTLDSEVVSVLHVCDLPETFEDESHEAEDFIVVIEGDEIVEWGEYYAAHMDVLKAIARKHNLKIKTQEVRE